MAKKKNNRNKKLANNTSFKPQKTARMANDALQLSRDGHPDKARALLLQAASRDPKNPGIHYNLGVVCNILHDFDTVVVALSKSIRYDSSNMKRVMTMGTGHFNAGRFPEAAACYRSVCNQEPTIPEPWYHYGQVLLAMGQEDEAAAAFYSSKEANASYIPAYYGLSQCAELTAEQFEQIEGLLDGAPEQAAKYGHYSLGYLQHRAGEYSKAIEHFKQANNLGVKASAQTPTKAMQDLTGHISLMQGIFNKEYFLQRSDWGIKGVSPLFIVGMPLSGTRPLGQLLSRAPGVNYAGEFSWFNQMIFQLLGKNDNDFNRLVASLDSDLVSHLANDYLKAHSPSFQGQGLILDNNPYNFLNLWLAKLMFPECRIIDCQRDKLSNILACYFTDIISQPFMLDLFCISQYYGGYETIMAFWRDNLGAQIINYSPSGELSAVNSFAGIEAPAKTAELGAFEAAIITPESAANYKSYIPVGDTSFDFSAAGGANGGLKLDFGSSNNSVDKHDFNLKF